MKAGVNVSCDICEQNYLGLYLSLRKIGKILFPQDIISMVLAMLLEILY